MISCKTIIHDNFHHLWFYIMDVVQTLLKLYRDYWIGKYTIFNKQRNQIIKGFDINRDNSTERSGILRISGGNDIRSLEFHKIDRTR